VGGDVGGGVETGRGGDEATTVVVEVSETGASVLDFELALGSESSLVGESIVVGDVIEEVGDIAIVTVDGV